LFFFDKSFSFLKQKENQKILEKFENKKTAFLSGFIVTALTMSLSVSVTILLPLYLRKLIDRRLLIAYILGANISTLFDTLFLGIMTKSILGIQVIISFLIAVTLAVSLYLLIFKYYRRSIGRITDLILKNKYSFLAFTIIAMAIPILFLIH
jgi:Na+/phosphate symporter